MSIKISIMGDSISTYHGYNPKEYGVYYTQNIIAQNSLESVDDTWWKQVIDELGGELCVNNSFTATTVSAFGIKPACSEERCSNLHNDVIPDIILIYMGTNDRGFGVDIGIDEADNYFKFYGAYRIMLKQIKSNYPNAKIICSTLLLGYLKGHKDSPNSQNFIE